MGTTMYIRGEKVASEKARILFGYVSLTSNYVVLRIIRTYGIIISPILKIMEIIQAPPPKNRSSISESEAEEYMHSYLQPPTEPEKTKFFFLTGGGEYDNLLMSYIDEDSEHLDTQGTNVSEKYIYPYEVGAQGINDDCIKKVVAKINPGQDIIHIDAHGNIRSRVLKSAHIINADGKSAETTPILNTLQDTTGCVRFIMDSCHAGDVLYGGYPSLVPGTMIFALSGKKHPSNVSSCKEY